MDKSTSLIYIRANILSIDLKKTQPSKIECYILSVPYFLQNNSYANFPSLMKMIGSTNAGEICKILVIY